MERNMSEAMVSLKEGYLAMYDFFDAYMQRVPTPELPISSMSLLADGSPADSGMEYDWARAIERVTGRSSSEPISAHEAYLAMYSFLTTYNDRGPEADIDAMLKAIAPKSNGEPAEPSIWSDWLYHVGRAKTGQVNARMILAKESSS
jgi:hypothetical protein